jgi:zinc D-Ala-D-Ala carboxypeptidase
MPGVDVLPARPRARGRPGFRHLLVAGLAVVVLGGVGLTVAPQRSTAQQASALPVSGHLPPPRPVAVLARPAPPVQQPADAADPPDPGALASGPQTVRRLDPELRRRLATAIKAARADGVRMTVTSGWRSARQQERLISYYTRKVGSRQAAYRWALPVADSLHVTGEAVDIGAGAGWLRSHGWTYGLCRRYRSEAWHFEMLADPGERCPALEDHPIARHP